MRASSAAAFSAQQRGAELVEQLERRGQRLARRRAALGPPLDRPLRRAASARARTAAAAARGRRGRARCARVRASWSPRGGGHERPARAPTPPRARLAPSCRPFSSTNAIASLGLLEPSERDQRLDLVLDDLRDRELADPRSLQLRARRPQPGGRLRGVAAAERGEPERRLGSAGGSSCRRTRARARARPGALARLVEMTEMGEHQRQRDSAPTACSCSWSRTWRARRPRGRAGARRPSCRPAARARTGGRARRAARLVPGLLHPGELGRQQRPGGVELVRVPQDHAELEARPQVRREARRAGPRARAHGPSPRAGTWSRAPRRRGRPRRARSRAATRRPPARRTARPRACGPPSARARRRST